MQNNNTAQTNQSKQAQATKKKNNKKRKQQVVEETKVVVEQPIVVEKEPEKPKQTTKDKVKDIGKKVAKAVLNYVATPPIAEIIIDLATALFGVSPSSTSKGRKLNRHHSHLGYSPKLDPTLPIPAGTILFTVPICPEMCRLPENRLTQEASVHSYYKMVKGKIRQVPSESMFVGGSIAMFIIPDPAKEIVVSDSESVQALVAEFKGGINRIDTKGSIDIGPPNRDLSISTGDPHNPRDYFQGTLYIVAYSQIPVGAVLPSYVLDIKQPMWAGNNVPAVTVVPKPYMNFVSLFSPQSNPVIGISQSLNVQTTLPLAPASTDPYLVVGDGSFFQGITGTDNFKLSPGVYKINALVNVAAQMQTSVSGGTGDGGYPELVLIGIDITDSGNAVSLGEQYSPITSCVTAAGTIPITGSLYFSGQFPVEFFMSIYPDDPTFNPQTVWRFVASSSAVNAPTNFSWFGPPVVGWSQLTFMQLAIIPEGDNLQMLSKITTGGIINKPFRRRGVVSTTAPSMFKSEAISKDGDTDYEFDDAIPADSKLNNWVSPPVGQLPPPLSGNVTNTETIIQSTADALSRRKSVDAESVMLRLAAKISELQMANKSLQAENELLAQI